MVMLRKKKSGPPEKIEQQMTAMIDIVFQLLAFFVMTFKVATPEGDFSINMPSGPPSHTNIEQVNLPPIRLAMTADANGNLASMTIEGTRVPDFRALATWMRGKHAELGGPTGLAKDQEVELLCDYRLKYGNTMAAVSAVSGYVDSSTGTPVALFEKVKFSRPKRKPGT